MVVTPKLRQIEKDCHCAPSVDVISTSERHRVNRSKLVELVFREQAQSESAHLQTRPSTLSKTRIETTTSHNRLEQIANFPPRPAPPAAANADAGDRKHDKKIRASREGLSVHHIRSYDMQKQEYPNMDSHFFLSNGKFKPKC
ncbi:hypothetical protein EVAR_17202_1 [Eumeta japonica]|uniref:Uncharacterized protein n=1 Tax=Eumeta variegata TaxID=151549 RepID=A0A4C1U972_EUMVA|nr:hypothetical protein EVAR_17202_1 [Eumeta japonica]